MKFKPRLLIINMATPKKSEKISSENSGGIVERKHRKARELFIFRWRVHLLREKKPCPVVF